MSEHTVYQYDATCPRCQELHGGVAERIAKALEAVPDEFYPSDVFGGPISTDDATQANQLLQDAGLPPLDHFSANVMRHAYRQAARIARDHGKAAA